MVVEIFIDQLLMLIGISKGNIQAATAKKKDNPIPNQITSR
jgi:hypothetical protein